jgi:hypothetical protein
VLSYHAFDMRVTDERMLVLYVYITNEKNRVRPRTNRWFRARCETLCYPRLPKCYLSPPVAVRVLAEYCFEKGCQNGLRKADFRRSTATVSANNRQMRMEVGC